MNQNKYKLLMTFSNVITLALINFASKDNDQIIIFVYIGMLVTIVFTYLYDKEKNKLKNNINNFLIYKDTGITLGMMMVLAGVYAYYQATKFTFIPIVLGSIISFLYIYVNDRDSKMKSSKLSSLAKYAASASYIGIIICFIAGYLYLNDFKFAFLVMLLGVLLISYFTYLYENEKYGYSIGKNKLAKYCLFFITLNICALVIKAFLPLNKVTNKIEVLVVINRSNNTSLWMFSSLILLFILYSVLVQTINNERESDL